MISSHLNLFAALTWDKNGHSNDLKPYRKILFLAFWWERLYGLAAVGLSLVFGVTKFLNVAHGELLMIGGYASFWIFSLWDIGPFLSFPLNILVLSLIGLVLYKLLFVRMVKLG